MTQNMLFSLCLWPMFITCSPGCHWLTASLDPFNCTSKSKSIFITQFIHGAALFDVCKNDERELKRKNLLGNNQSECGGNKIKWDMACQNDFPTNGCLFTSCLLTDKNAIGRFDVLECWWKRENKIQVEKVLFFPLSLSLKILCTSKWMKFGTKQCRIQSWHIWQAFVRSNSMRWNSMEPSYIGHNVKINKSPMFRQ